MTFTPPHQQIFIELSIFCRFFSNRAAVLYIRNVRWLPVDPKCASNPRWNTPLPPPFSRRAGPGKVAADSPIWKVNICTLLHTCVMDSWPRRAFAASTEDARPI